MHNAVDLRGGHAHQLLAISDLKHRLKHSEDLRVFASHVLSNRQGTHVHVELRKLVSHVGEAKGRSGNLREVRGLLELLEVASHAV